MKQLLVIVLIAMGFAVLAEQRSKKNYFLNEKGYWRRDAFFCTCMTLILAVFAGLRTGYNDTVTYIRSYELLEVDKSIFEGMIWSLSASDGFELTTRIMKGLGASTQTFLMLFSLFNIGVNVWFIRKYAHSLWLSFFLYITMGCYVFNMAAIMQCTATAIILIALDRLIEGKKLKFVLLVLLATTFHTYAFMFILAPLLFFTPWSKKTYWMLGGFLLIGLMLPSLLGVVISVTSAMGEGYTADSFMGAGVNIFRFLVVSVPVVLSFLVRNRIEKEANRTDMFILNLSMLNAEIMFVALFGTANYFARLANYFLMFQTITLPWLLRFFPKSTRQIMSVCMVLCYFLYFYYESGINMPFDLLFDKVGLLDYLKSFI